MLDAACGPGLYAARLAAAGYDVTGVDVNVAALRHARAATRAQGLQGRLRFTRGDLHDLAPPRVPYDAALLVYHVLEAFPRAEQTRVLRRLAASLVPDGTVIVEMRLRPDQLPGRVDWWEVVPHSVLADRRHLLIGDTTYDARRNLYVLREIAVFDDGSIAAQQTSAWLCPYDAIAPRFALGGFRVDEIHDGWSPRRATPLSETVVVVARRRPDGRRTRR